MTKPGDHVKLDGRAYECWCVLGNHWVKKYSAKTVRVRACDPCLDKLEKKRAKFIGKDKTE